MIGLQALLNGSRLKIRAPKVVGTEQVLTPKALDFVAELCRRFEEQRQALLRERDQRQRTIDEGELPSFLSSTEEIRKSDWTIAPLPQAMLDRRVEITGPVERKMMINALNSGARVFMADFEDANAPTWENIIAGHINLRDAINGTIEYAAANGKQYRLSDRPATLMVRPRGWHLPEKHVLFGDTPISGSLFDFGLFIFHNGKLLSETGRGPYLYLPKMESHLEARLWNDVFILAEERLGIAAGTIKATVLIETIPAVFEMDEILYELREHSAGLNAGRWDYLFSIIKKFRNRKDFVWPDRAQLTMTVPCMRAYTNLLVKTCHRRNAPAIGGMAAFIPSRTNPEINTTALRRVREDKERESGDGFDGTWVAHPDLVPVAQEVFDSVLGRQLNQMQRKRPDVFIEANDLLNFAISEGAITECGLRANISVTLRYIASWLSGTGAAAIDNLMEDVATAEIARSQVWQWIHHGASLKDGRAITPRLVADVESGILRQMRDVLGDEAYTDGRFEDASEIFQRVAIDDKFVEFLTLTAYDYIS